MEDKAGYPVSDNVSRTLGKDAQRNNIQAAKIIAEIVKTTLGPKGMDKMLVDSSGNVIVTNDGVTILEEMEIDHPAAKMVVDIAKTQESEVGDGTTTAALLTGKLLENAEKLLDRKIHPTVIIKGYKLAAEKALSLLEEISSPLNSREILVQIAKTAMTGKGAEGNKDLLSELVVKSAEQVGSNRDISLNDIKIQKIKGGKVSDSSLISGFVLDKDKANAAMPSIISPAKILLIDFSLEIKNPETETKISISTPEQLESFLNAEEHYLKDLTEKMINSGANAIFCQKGISDLVQYYLAKAGILACRRVPKSDLEKIGKATSAKIISNLEDLSLNQLGSAETVEEVKEGLDSYIYIRGCKNPKTVTLVVKGSTEHVVDEIERAIKDSLGDVAAAIKSGKVVAGGGAIEVELARRLRIYSKTLSGREQLAIEEFANSLESIPETLAENAGLDPIEIITELRKSHEVGNINHGINLFTDKVEDTMKAGIIEPIKVKTQAISSASEVATLILRIDDVLISKDSSRSQKVNPYEGLD